MDVYTAQAKYSPRLLPSGLSVSVLGPLTTEDHFCPFTDNPEVTMLERPPPTLLESVGPSQAQSYSYVYRTLDTRVKPYQLSHN